MDMGSMEDSSPAVDAARHDAIAGRSEGSHKDDRLARIEDRMLAMEEQLRSTNRTMQELSSLMQRQLESVAVQNRRRLSHELTPQNIAMQPRALGPTYSVARIAMDVADSRPDLDTVSPVTSDDEDQQIEDIGAADPKEAQSSPPQESQASKVTPLTSKKVSMDLAVMNSERSERVKGPDTVPPAPSGQEYRRESKPTATALSVVVSAAGRPGSLRKAPIPDRKFHLETPLSQRNLISRHLSTRTIGKIDGKIDGKGDNKGDNKGGGGGNASTQQQRRIPRRSRWSQILFKNIVSPEELLDARDPNHNVHRFTLRHDSSERYAWDILVMVMLLVEVVLTPLAIGFDVDTPVIRVFSVIGTVIFAGDFFIQMLSSFTDDRGKVVSGPRNTASNYLLSVWAVPDFLGWFPFEQLMSPSNSRAFGITKVIRLAKVSQLARRLHSAKKAGALRFARLLGIVFVTSHVLSCYWYFIATEWKLHVMDGTFKPRGLGELYALCWSLVIGCLNASPPIMYTATEAVSVGVFMLIGNLVQASVFGAVAVLLSSIDEEEAHYNQKIITVYERCRFLGIPDDLMRRIRGYYEHLWRETKSISCDADAFINELSPALICEVKFQLYRDMLTQIPFLSANKVSPTVIEMLILHLRTVIYMQDDVLIRKGEVGDWMGFIGSKGSVGVLDPSSHARKFIRILRKGDYFGEMALLQRAKRSTTAVALSWVQIHVLCRADLDNVKEQYPTQAEVLEDEINKYMQSKVTYR